MKKRNAYFNVKSSEYFREAEKNRKGKRRKFRQGCISERNDSFKSNMVKR